MTTTTHSHMPWTDKGGHVTSKPGGEDNGRMSLNMVPHLAALPRLLEALTPLQRQALGLLREG